MYSCAIDRPGENAIRGGTTGFLWTPPAAGSRRLSSLVRAALDGRFCARQPIAVGRLLSPLVATSHSVVAQVGFVVRVATGRSDTVTTGVALRARR